MKKLIQTIFLAVILIYSIVTLSNNVNAGDVDDLKISLIEYSPMPVIPGNFFTIKLRAKNIASTNLTDVELDFKSRHPFSIDEDKVRYNLLEPGEEITLTFVVEVDSEAQSGFKKLKLEYEVDNDEEEKSFNIQVQAIETTLVVTSVTSEPEEIAPGDTATVKITIKNLANILLKDVTIKLDLSSEDLPFAPIYSVTEKRIDSIKANEEKELEFKIIALADAESKIYKVPLKLNYYDEFGEYYEKDDVIALIIGTTPDLYISIEESNLIMNTKGKLTLKLVNKGLTDIKFLTVSLAPSNNYELISPNNVYLGNIDSDDYEIVDFELDVKDKKSIPITLNINYKDANNKDYNKEVILDVEAYSLQEAKKLGLIKTSYGLVVLFVILLIVVFFIYRKVRKKK